MREISLGPTVFHSKIWQIPRLTAATLMKFRGCTGEISAAWLNHESTSQIHVMNLWILHYSLINHHFHKSTSPIKPKINVNKLVTELLWGHFLWKNSCSNEKRQIPRQKDEFGGKFRGIKFRGSKIRGRNPYSAAFRGTRKTVGPSCHISIGY